MVTRLRCPGSARRRGRGSFRSASSGSASPATSRTSTANTGSTRTPSSMPRRAPVCGPTERFECCNRPLSAGSTRLPLLRAGAHRGGVPRQFQLLPGVGQPVAIDLEDRDVLVGKITDIDIIPIRAEDDALGQPTDWDLAGFGDLFAVDFQRHGGAVGVVIK